MIKESKMSLTGEELAEAFEEKLISFDNPRQRGECWKPEQQGLLIRSMIVGYPIPPLYAVKTDEKLDVIDGKQRATTIIHYINNEFAIYKSVPSVEISGEEYNLSGKKYSDLPDIVQRKINRRTIEINYLNGITDENDIDNIFCLLNNGTPMSKIYLTCAKTKCIEKVNLASEHDIFNSELSQKYVDVEKYDHKESVIKSYLTISLENPSFSTGEIQNIMENTEIADDAIMKLWEYYNILFEVYKYLAETYGDIGKSVIKKIAKNKGNHFAAMIHVIHNNIDSCADTKNLAEWVMSFFNTGKNNGISIDEQYNASTKSVKGSNVQLRHSIILERYRAYKGV